MQLNFIWLACYLHSSALEDSSTGTIIVDLLIFSITMFLPPVTCITLCCVSSAIGHHVDYMHFIPLLNILLLSAIFCCGRVKPSSLKQNSLYVWIYQSSIWRIHKNVAKGKNTSTTKFDRTFDKLLVARIFTLSTLF